MKKYLLSLVLILPSVGSAGLISHTDYTSGATITASGQNSNENAIFNEFNGNIDNNNIKAGGVQQSNIASGVIDATRLTSTVQAQLLPPGVILPYVAETAPTGFLECNGAAVSRTTYAALYAVIGTNYGQGDNSTTFNVPDMRGKFARGWDHGAGNDSYASTRSTQTTGGKTGDHVGSVEADTTSLHGIVLADPGHVHDLLGSGTGGIGPVQLGDSNSSSVAGVASGSGTGYSTVSPKNGSNYVRLTVTGITISGALETAPKNVNVMYIIKT